MSKTSSYQLLRTKSPSTEAAAEAPWDLGFIIPVILLTVIGVVMVYSASYPLVLRVGHHQGYYYAERQALFALFGLTALFVVSRIKMKIIYRWAYPLLGVALGLLLVVLQIGRMTNGARSWLNLGPFSFQPSEFAKVALLLALARFFADYPKATASFKGLLPALAMVGAVCGLVLKGKDFGTAASIGLAVAALFFLSGVRFRHLAGLVAGAGAVGTAFIIHEPYRMARILSFLNPAAHTEAGGYQILRSLIALGSGGLMGRGFAASREKFFYLPNPETDSIFAVIGEELGLIFCLGIVGLFCWLGWRGMKIAAGSRDKFSSLVAVGMTNLIVIQAAINLLVILDLLPPTGLPLPFLSYGGSALLLNFIAVGLVANISRQGGFAEAAAAVPAARGRKVAGEKSSREKPGGRVLRPRNF